MPADAAFQRGFNALRFEGLRVHGKAKGIGIGGKRIAELLLLRGREVGEQVRDEVLLDILKLPAELVVEVGDAKEDVFS